MGCTCFECLRLLSCRSFFLEMPRAATLALDVTLVSFSFFRLLVVLGREKAFDRLGMSLLIAPWPQLTMGEESALVDGCTRLF